MGVSPRCTGRLLALFAWIAIPLAAAAQAVSIPMQEISPARSTDALTNPGLGLYCFGTLNPEDMPADAWFTPLVQIGYFRDDWSLLEPDSEGKYRFDEYFSPIFDLWVKRWHKRVAFRFMSENMHSQRRYVTPKWVFDQGVPSVTLKGLYVPEQTDPVFWDDRYLRIQERFIADLGKCLDGRPGLEFVDIGSIGEWGEMHLARWTPELLKQAGYSEAKYIGAYRRIIDAFARAFPHTRVFLNVGDYETINDYAAICGLHFRQDGLTPSGPSADVGKRFYVPYSRRGVICNYELHSGYEEMRRKGWGIKETFAKGLEDPISYLHINLMSYRQLGSAPAEVREAVTDAARRIGFRFVLSRLRCNRTIHLSQSGGGRILAEHTWTNVGVAPCYASYALQWTVTDVHGKVVAEQISYPRRPTTRWWPGETVALKDVISVPAGTQAGAYRLRVAMVEPENPAVRIQIGNAGREADGSYDLCGISAEMRSAGAGSAYSEGFESGTGGWGGGEGVALRVDSESHTGKRCLLVSGRPAANAWSYAQIELGSPVLPASRYQLSCWMKIDALAAGAPAPYLKIGLTDSKGAWITNIQTNAYDMGKLGTWQKLVAYVETTPDTAGGQLAIEKGDLEGRYSVTLRLDDIALDLLESP